MRITARIEFTEKTSMALFGALVAGLLALVVYHQVWVLKAVILAGAFFFYLMASFGCLPIIKKDDPDTKTVAFIAISVFLAYLMWVSFVPF